MFSQNEYSKLLLLVKGELLFLEQNDRKDTNEFMELKRLERKLIRLSCEKL